VSRRARIALKTGVWALCLTPLGLLAGRAWTGDLTPNPIDFVTDTLGQWGLRLLLASLALTPLRILFGVGWPLLVRRLLGLFAFAYLVLHFAVFVVLDHFFDWRTMLDDVTTRPWVMAGFGGLLLLAPLAATSTAGMVRRLGGRTWRRLHRAVYVAAVLGVVHYIWLAKKVLVEPYVYAAILVLLLGVRAGDAVRRRARRRAATPAGRPILARADGERQ
jgi:sulfoxide reductase heme-binding subunit YedZ